MLIPGSEAKPDSIGSPSSTGTPGNAGAPINVRIPGSERPGGGVIWGRDASPSGERVCGGRFVHGGRLWKPSPW